MKRDISGRPKKQTDDRAGGVRTKIGDDLVGNLPLILILHDLAHNTLDGLGNVVNVLGLDDGLQVVLQNLGEIVLKLRTTEVSQDLLPVRGVLQSQLVSQTGERTIITAPGRERTSNLPRLGFSLPAMIFRAVDLPIPFVPTSPRT